MKVKMDKTEEVKKILDKYFEETTDTAKDPCLRDITKEIVKLFTPPTDEGLREISKPLLSRESLPSCLRLE